MLAPRMEYSVHVRWTRRSPSSVMRTIRQRDLDTSGADRLIMFLLLSRSSSRRKADHRYVWRPPTMTRAASCLGPIALSAGLASAGVPQSRQRSASGTGNDARIAGISIALLSRWPKTRAVSPCARLRARLSCCAYSWTAGVSWEEACLLDVPQCWPGELARWAPLIASRPHWFFVRGRAPLADYSRAMHRPAPVTTAQSSRATTNMNRTCRWPASA